jgi:uncharacterized protein GlcG (DUF336 family)
MALVETGLVRLTLEGAQLALSAAMDRARAIGVDMDVAVADSAGILLAFARMDGAKLTSVEIAINKAFTAACTRKGTHEYAGVAGCGGGAFGIHASHGGRFSIFGGGVPILVDGQCIGAVGCSSGSAEQDRDVADAGVRALLEAMGGAA